MQAARHGHDVHVITRANNGRQIEEKLRNDPVPGLSFHYFDLPTPFRRWKKRTGYYGLLAYYYLWQLSSSRVAQRLHGRYHFDLTHNVTFVMDWMPSGVAQIGVPFIWGPVGGTTNVLRGRMRQFVPPTARRYEAVRRTMQIALKWGDPLVAITRRRASVILTFTREAVRGIPRKHRHKARPIVHIGVTPSEVPQALHIPGTAEIITVVTGSRLVHWKGFDLLIEGFARYVRSGQKGRLLITGDGPFRPQLEAMIESLAIEEHVELLGHLPSRADVLDIVKRADLYALPTLRDGPPVAILEAMSLGRPILCLDRGSTSELVPGTAGFKIRVVDRPQVIADIGAALQWANGHRDSLADMGAVARIHVLTCHDSEPHRGCRGDGVPGHRRRSVSRRRAPSLITRAFGPLPKGFALLQPIVPSWARGDCRPFVRSAREARPRLILSTRPPGCRAPDEVSPVPFIC